MYKLMSSSMQKLELPRKFPFSIGDSQGVNENSRMLHWHKEVEICYIKKGTGKYLINGYEYPFDAGDVFIINNDEIHLAYEDRNLVMQVALFDPSIINPGGNDVMDYEYLTPFLETGRSMSNKLDRDNPYMKEVIDILLEIQEEFEHRIRNYELMIKSLLLKLMATILRFFAGAGETEQIHKINPSQVQKVKNVIEYIDLHYQRPVTLNDLTVLSGMSISHFSNIFKKFTGTSPMEYVTGRRIIAAKSLLHESDRKIIEIALECGFNSIPSFNRCFREYTGTSPGEYSNRKN